jgi:hypothetical protein
MTQFGGKGTQGSAHRNGGGGGGSAKSGEDSRSLALNDGQMGAAEDEGGVGCV